MANLVKITSANSTYFVNADNVNYVVSHVPGAPNCVITFEKGHDVFVNKSVEEVAGLLFRK